MDKKEIIEEINMIFENHKEAGEAIFIGGYLTGGATALIGLAVGVGIYNLYDYIVYNKSRKEIQKRYEEFNKNLF